MCVEVLCFCDV